MSSPGDNGQKKEGDNGENTTPPPVAKVEVSDYVVVQDDEGGEPMELPVTKDDNSLGMNTLTSAFPGSHGLKFKNPKTGASRALMLDPSGTKFLAPVDGWDGKTFTVIFPPSRGTGEAKRRKFGDGSDSEDDEGAAKQKRFDDKPTDLICLGVNYTTTGETFKKHFEQFGEVVSADLKLNFEGKSKGFGFVLMASLAEQERVLNADKHEIDGRRVEVKVPDARSENFRNPLLPREQSTNKVFVGRLPETTTDELRNFFEAEAKKLNPHANITDCFLPRPFRGFGFVTFSTCEMARKICVSNNFVMKGAPLAVSLAVPRDDPPMGGGGRGGRDSMGMGAMMGGRGIGGANAMNQGYGEFQMSPTYGYGYGDRSEFGRGVGGGAMSGYDDWSGTPRYNGSWEEKSPNRGGPRAGPPPAALSERYGGGGGGSWTDRSSYGYNTPSPSTQGVPSGGGGYNGSMGGGGGAAGGGQSLSMALAGNIPTGLGGGGGRVGGAGPPPSHRQPPPQQQQQQQMQQQMNNQPASLASGLDQLNLNRNNNPEVFSAAWAVFMNTLKNGSAPNGGPPNGGPPPPPQQHHQKW